MSSQRILRLLLDLSMVFLFLIVMGESITGQKMHEVLGAVLLILFIIHNLLHRAWYIRLFRGPYSARRLLSISLNFALLLSLVLLFASLPLMSGGFPKSGFTGRELHILGAYWCFLLTAVHLGVHWEPIRSGFSRLFPADSLKKAGFILGTIFLWSLAFYGAWAFIEREWGLKLILYFSYSPPEASAAKFYLDSLAILICFAGIGHRLQKFLQNPG